MGEEHVCVSVCTTYLHTIDVQKRFVQIKIIKIEPGNTITPFAGMHPPHRNGGRRMA